MHKRRAFSDIGDFDTCTNFDDRNRSAGRNDALDYGDSHAGDDTRGFDSSGFAVDSAENYRHDNKLPVRSTKPLPKKLDYSSG